jgi:hypothetical protein
MSSECSEAVFQWQMWYVAAISILLLLSMNSLPWQKRITSCAVRIFLQVASIVHLNPRSSAAIYVLPPSCLISTLTSTATYLSRAQHQCDARTSTSKQPPRKMRTSNVCSLSGETQHPSEFLDVLSRSILGQSASFLQK